MINAIEHLLRVSAGIDSMVLGETQILGQVRDSFLRRHKQLVQQVLFLIELFKQAVTFAKTSAYRNSNR